jgi:hypothetical protein
VTSRDGGPKGVHCGNSVLEETEARNGFRFSTKMREPQLCGISRMDLAPADKMEVGTSGPRPIGHFWLYERCSNVYTLHYSLAGES